MNEIKVRNFERENNCPFPQFRSLAVNERDGLRRALAQKIGLPLEIDKGQLLEHLHKHMTIIPSANADTESFDAAALMTQLGFPLKGTVYINWDQFDEIDVLSSSVFADHFSDLWYPSSDDIEIISEDLNAIMAVRHDGAVSLWKSKGQ
jgi:hypothetical protein